MEQAGVPILSAPILFAAGALVGFGRMNCTAALGLPLVACLICDCAWYSVGQRRGPTILGFVHRISPRSGVGVTDIGSLFSRHGRVSIVLAKFVPGFGILVPPLADFTRGSPLRFLLLDAFGALAWAAHISCWAICFERTWSLWRVCARKQAFLLRYPSLPR